MKEINRREFIQHSASGTAVLSTVPMIRASQGRKYRTALIGSGWWGNNILRAAMESGRNKIVALCDVDQKHLDSTFDTVRELTGENPTMYRDYRDLLEKEKPEIAIVATPDHWHPLVTIAAIEAGAHVYVEKPISHTIGEGRAMITAAREHDRVVQVGTHRRASPHNISGMQFLKSGRAGRIGMVRAFVHSAGSSWETTPDSEPPPHLDWEMWCGPAPRLPFNEAIHPRGFRQFLEYANGTLGDWGIHWMDQILWWTEEEYPRVVSSTGGRFLRNDNTNAPDTQVATYEFESFTAVWEHRHYAGNESEKHRLGCYFYGSEGVFHMGWRDGWTFYPREDSKPILHEDPRLHKPDDQNIPELWADFLDSIDQQRLPICDIEIGHRATVMSLLGMISLKLGRSVKWDGRAERIPADPEANQLLSREYRGSWEYPSA